MFVWYHYNLGMNAGKLLTHSLNLEMCECLSYMRKFLALFHSVDTQKNTTEPHFRLVKICSGNVFVSSGNKTLHEPTLTKYYDTTLRYQGLMSSFDFGFRRNVQSGRDYSHSTLLWRPYNHAMLRCQSLNVLWIIMWLPSNWQSKQSHVL